MLPEHLLKLDTCFIRVKHGFWQGSSLKLTSSFTRRGVTEEVRANGLIEGDSGYHALFFLIFLQIFSCDVIIYQRQWGVILIHEQCLPKKKRWKERIFVWFVERNYVRDITGWVCRQDECTGKLWILFLSWSGIKATELEFVWIPMCRQQTHRHCAETQAVINFDDLYMWF